MGRTVDPKTLEVMSYYRDAELHGSTLLLAMGRRAVDPAEQLNLARHLADETRHAWLWTKRIVDLGGAPARVGDGYQMRLRREVGLPRTAPELYSLTLVAEQRAQSRYRQHLEWAGVDGETADLLLEIMRDEKWHLDWVGRQLSRLAEAGFEEQIEAALDRYREADARIVAALTQKECARIGAEQPDTGSSR